MSRKLNTDFYANWAKERIDEMDAILGSLETRLNEVHADAKAKAHQLIADLKKRRDEFQAISKKHAAASEPLWEKAKTQLESNWTAFEAQVKTYVETVGKQLGQRQAIFSDVSAAQAKAWHDAAKQFHAVATGVAAAHRGDIDAAIKQMQRDASEAEARLQKLRQAGTESWSGMSAALAESRRAFDKANHAAWEALKRAAQ